MAAIEVKGSAIKNVPEDLKDKTLYVSDSFPITYDGQKGIDPIFGKSVTVAATGLTYILQEKNGSIDFSKEIAKRSYDGTYAPGPQAAVISPTGLLATKITTQNGVLANDFNDKASGAIKSVLTKQNGGTVPSQNEISQVLDKGIANGKYNTQALSSVRPPGQPPPAGQTGGEADVAGNREIITDAITKLSSIAMTINGKSAEIREDVKELTYPLKFPGGMDYIKFGTKNYGTKNFSSKTLSFTKRDNGQELESVILPIQSSISDANTVGWNEETFNPAQVIGANLAISGIEGGAPGLIGQLQETMKKLTGNKSDVEKAIIAYFTEQAVGVQVLPKLSGAVFNPNTELLFQGPQLRSFNFSFKLTPRSAEEAKRVKTIIAFFKRNMAAQTVEGELYLKAPKVFGITYYHRDKQDHPGIGLVKDCALQACNVDYTPDGSYMAFDDGSMVSYSLNLQFMELEPIYSTDYDDARAKPHGIGY